MNKIRQILAFVRSLLDFLLNLGSHTPQKQPPHDTTDTPTEPTPPFPPLPPARLGQPLPAGGTLPPARHAGGGAGGYRGDTLALVHPSPGPLNLLGWGLILSAALSSLGKTYGILFSDPKTKRKSMKMNNSWFLFIIFVHSKKISEYQSSQI